MVHEPIILTLPEPPSSNIYWRVAGSRIHRSHAADRYKAVVALATKGYRKDGAAAIPEGPIALVLVWHRSIKRGDLDNRLKITCDALAGFLYSEDAQIVQIWARRVDAHPTVPKGHVLIEVCPIEDSPAP